MSKEVEEAIERVEDTIYNHSGYGINHFKKITFYEDGIEDIKKLLNYIKELEEEKEIYKNELEKVDKALNVKVGIAMPSSSDIIESMKKSVTQYKMIAENSIPKQVIKELKEKIHNTLDKNGITRGYQLKIDEYFDELLKEDV